MKHKILSSAGILLLATLPAICQQNTPQETQGSVPLYRVTVVERTVRAINYQYRSDPTLIDFTGTVLMPKAKGQATVQSKQGRTEIDVHFENLTGSQNFGREYLAYVLWALSPDGRPHNIGEVIPGGSNKASLRVTTDLQAFALIVTAEPYSSVRQPSDVVVLENQIRPDTVGKFEPVEVHYELMPRGTYTWHVSDQINSEVANAPRVSMRKYEALTELYQAQNAVAIARAANADKYAPNTLAKAEQLLTTAQQFEQNKHVEDARVVEEAREAAETAEDARVIAEQHQQQEKLANAEARINAAQQTEAQAQAQIEQARVAAQSAQAQVDAERAARQRAEADAAAARQSALDAQAQVQAMQQAQVVSQVDQQRREVRQRQAMSSDKTALRMQLFERLNGVYETRDTPRGLVVTIPAASFSRGELRPVAIDQIARISPIIASHPGLRVEIDGYTNHADTEALSTNRAQAVRSILGGHGLDFGLITARGMGNTHPLAAAGREENERVEIVISGDPIGAMPFWDRPYTLTPTTSPNGQNR